MHTQPLARSTWWVANPLIVHPSTTTIITLEPCALNAEFHHFILRFNKNFITLQITLLCKRLVFLFFCVLWGDLPQEKKKNLSALCWGRSSYSYISYMFSCSHKKRVVFCAWRFPDSWVLLRFGNTFGLMASGGTPPMGFTTFQLRMDPTWPLPFVRRITFSKKSTSGHNFLCRGTRLD